MRLRRARACPPYRRVSRHHAAIRRTVAARSFAAATAFQRKIRCREVAARKGLRAICAALTPNEQSESYLRFEWPTALVDVPAGTVLLFEFRLHGKAEGVEQYITKAVTLVAA